MRHDEYNGWTNYETWLVNIWMDSSGERDAIIEDIRDDLDRGDEDDRVIAVRVADRIMGTAYDEMTEMVRENGMFRDLLTSALQEVNWEEIGKMLVEDATEGRQA